MKESTMQKVMGSHKPMNPIDRIPGHLNVERLVEAYIVAFGIFSVIKKNDQQYGCAAMQWLEEYGPKESSRKGGAR